MKARCTRARRHPPWWCRAALYAATWPRPEFYDYRIKLQREYLRRSRVNKGDAEKYVRNGTVYWLWVAWWRIMRAFVRLMFIDRIVH